MRGHVAHHRRPRSHHGPLTDGHSGQDHGHGPHRATVGHRHPHRGPVAVSLDVTIRRDRAGSHVVGEAGTRPDEAAVADGGRSVDEGMVLDLHAVADDHAGIDVGATADNAVTTHLGSGADVGIPPNPGPVAERGTCLYLGGGVDLGTHADPQVADCVARCFRRRHPACWLRRLRPRRARAPMPARPLCLLPSECCPR